MTYPAGTVKLKKVPTTRILLVDHILSTDSLAVPKLPGTLLPENPNPV
jgi:hypothetical protein